MARRVYFSFHYQRDIFRASIVRKSGLTHPDRDSAGFFDAAKWESLKLAGDKAIKRWIDKELSGTSVTAVLIGAKTSTRPYVHYEIKQSIALRKGLIGIRIHTLGDPRHGEDVPGANPFAQYPGGNSVPVYDWTQHSGYPNLGVWIENAAVAAGR